MGEALIFKIRRTDMRVLMTGGGTGGHVNPALAIAEIIKTNEPNSEIAFVGTERGIENTLVPKAGYKLYHVNIQGIRRSLSPSNLKTAYLVMTSPFEAKKIIKEFKPDIVIGTGAYVCWPLLRAASAMNIPTMIHESNAIAGFAVKQLKNKVDVIMTNFESTASSLDCKAKVMQVGNPISLDFGRYTKEEARRLLGIPEDIETVVLSLGGSLGAHRINEAMLKVMSSLTSKRPAVMHFHACGKNDLAYSQKCFAEYGLEGKRNIVLSEYIYNMPVMMAAADVVVCRAGAMTLSEVAAMRKASIIVPSPNVTDDHQYKNAKVLADADAAIVIRESELTDKMMIETVDALIKNPARREKMGENISAFATNDVRQRIYAEILELLKKGQKN